MKVSWLPPLLRLVGGEVETPGVGVFICFKGTVPVPVFMPVRRSSVSRSENRCKHPLSTNSSPASAFASRPSSSVTMRMLIASPLRGGGYVSAAAMITRVMVMAVVMYQSPRMLVDRVLNEAVIVQTPCKQFPPVRVTSGPVAEAVMEPLEGLALVLILVLRLLVCVGWSSQRW